MFELRASSLVGLFITAEEPKDGFVSEAIIRLTEHSPYRSGQQTGLIHKKPPVAN
jgi:hypothetical protein